MVVVWKRNTPDVGAFIPPLQLEETAAESAVEGGGTGHRIARKQMPVCLNL